MRVKNAFSLSLLDMTPPTTSTIPQNSLISVQKMALHVHSQLVFQHKHVAVQASKLLGEILYSVEEHITAKSVMNTFLKKRDG